MKDFGWSSFCACHDLVNVIPGTAAPHQVKRSHRTSTRFERNLTILSKKTLSRKDCLLVRRKIEVRIFLTEKKTLRRITRL